MKICKKCGGSWLTEFAVGCDHKEPEPPEPVIKRWKNEAQEYIFTASIEIPHEGSGIHRFTANHPVQETAIEHVKDLWRARFNPPPVPQDLQPQKMPEKPKELPPRVGAAKGSNGYFYSREEWMKMAQENSALVYTTLRQLGVLTVEFEKWSAERIVEEIFAERRGKTRTLSARHWLELSVGTAYHRRFIAAEVDLLGGDPHMHMDEAVAFVWNTNAPTIDGRKRETKEVTVDEAVESVMNTSMKHQLVALANSTDPFKRRLIAMALSRIGIHSQTQMSMGPGTRVEVILEHRLKPRPKIIKYS